MKKKLSNDYLKCIHRNGDVVYTNKQVGKLNNELVDAVLHNLSNDISCPMKKLLDVIGIDATFKKYSDKNGFSVSELYFRDKNTKGSRKVKVRTSYSLEVDDLLSGCNGKSTVEKSDVKGISEYCENVLGKWSDFRGSYDKMFEKDIKTIMDVREHVYKSLYKRCKKTKKKISGDGYCKSQ